MKQYPLTSLYVTELPPNVKKVKKQQQKKRYFHLKTRHWSVTSNTSRCIAVLRSFFNIPLPNKTAKKRLQNDANTRKPNNKELWTSSLLPSPPIPLIPGQQKWPYYHVYFSFLFSIFFSRVHMLRKEHGNSRPSLHPLQITMFPWKSVIRSSLPRLTMLIPQYALRCF